MATWGIDYIAENDVMVCSICFEKFKTPRFLPCKHSFCQGYLSSYIVSQRKSTEPRLGFYCPLCREYIPSEGNPQKPDGWAELFPLNDILQKMVDQEGAFLCEPCLRENDDEQATNYCVTCKEYLCITCTKYHGRSIASRNHTIFTVSEMNSIRLVSDKECANICPNHKHERVQLYCQNHDQPCCALCGATEHKKCEKVDTINNAIQALKEGGNMNALLNEVGEFKRKMLCEKSEKQNNLFEFENTVEENITKTENEFIAVVQHFEKLKAEHIEEMCNVMKRGRDKMQIEIEKVEDGIQCVANCEMGIKSAH